MFTPSGGDKSYYFMETINQADSGEIPRGRVRKAAVIGAAVGFVFTIAVFLWVELSPSKTIFDFSGFIMLQIVEPAVFMAKIFGKDMHWYVNDRTGSLAIFPFGLIIIVNSAIGLIFGAMVGKLIDYLNHKKLQAL